MYNKQIPKNVQKVLNQLKINNPIFLGKGGEGYIFTYTDDTVIKIYNNANETYLKSLEKLQSFITSKNLPFATPQVYEIEKIDSTYYTIEKRLKGISMEEKFPTLSSDAKYKLLKSYYEAIKSLNTIELPDLPYGSILQTSLYPITNITWEGFLKKMVKHRVELAGKQLRKDVIDLDTKIHRFEEIISKELAIDKKYLVHADYFINQVLVNDTNEISAILDISFHAVAGDKRLDIASLCFFEEGGDYLPEHINYLIKLAVKDYGESIKKYIDIYKIYYCFYFSDIYNFNYSFYQTIIKNLNNEDLWKKIS